MKSSVVIDKKKANPLNVLFVNIPTENLAPPLGLLYLADSIKDCSFINSYECADFRTVDMSGLFDEATGEVLLEKPLAEFINKNLIETVTNKPDIVAVSITFSSDYAFFKIAVEEIKKCWKNAVVIVGGIHATNSAGYLLETDPIDYVVVGEGEEAFPSLLEMIATGAEKNLLGVHSLANIKKTEENQFEKTATVENFNIDYTKYNDLIDMEAYTKGTELFSLSKTDISVRAFNIMSSRGCPYLCTYCSSWTVQGRGSRWRDFDNVIGEIRWLNKEYGATKFYLIDDNFIPKAKAVQLFNRLAELDAEIKDFELIVYNLSINATDYDTIDSMIGAGVNNLTFAIESGSKATQDKIKKWVKLDKALDLVAYAQSKGLHVRCFFVVGFPEETASDMEETFQYAKKLGADWSTFSVAAPIPGTEMTDQFVELGYVEDGPISWAGSTYRERGFDRKEISKEDVKELAYRANLNVNFVNNINIKRHDFKNAETIFSNFVKQYSFHIFAHDCLRRVYKGIGDVVKESETIETMKVLISSNSKSQSFRKYFDLLDDEILAQLPAAPSGPSNAKPPLIKSPGPAMIKY